MQSVPSIDRKCFLCGSSEQEIIEDFSGSALFLGTEFYHVDIKKVICLNCGLVYASRYPDPDYLNKLYTVLATAPDELLNQTDSSERHDYFIKTLDKMYQGSKKSILDVGCSRCETLDSFKGLGWETYGVDISPVSLEMGKAKGHHVRHGAFQDIDFESSQFDVILLEATLEHIPNPKHILRKAISLLSDTGYLALSVPEFYTCLKTMNVYDMLREDHCTHFIPLTIQGLLKSEGLHIKTMYIDVNPATPEMKVLACKTPDRDSNALHDVVGLEQIREEVHSYRRMKLKVQEVFTPLINKFKQVAVYCAGTYTTFILPSFFGYDFENCVAIIDNDQRKHGKSLFGMEVLPSSHLNVIEPEAILICSEVFEDVIYKQLKAEFPETEIICANRLIQEALSGAVFK